MKNKIKGIVAAVCMLAAGILFSWGVLEGDSRATAADQATEEVKTQASWEQQDQEQKTAAQSLEITDLPKEAEETDADAATVVWIHVCGQVASPGVYQAPEGSRVYQLVEMAGGLTKEASEEALNMAAFVTDGQQIYVPSREEAASMPNPAGGGAEAAPAKVNINTAGISQLCTLSGIGESRARDIIAYRESHGAFARVEDIMKVSGIKQAAFDKIKDSISVTD